MCKGFSYAKNKMLRKECQIRFLITDFFCFSDFVSVI